MRPQQRSFVIEYKSSRRQTLKQERSIWGDTNFKALAKEAEADAPQLFEPRAVDLADREAVQEPQQETVAIAPEQNTEVEDVTLPPIELTGSGDAECEFEALASVEPVVPISETSGAPVRKRRRRPIFVANARARLGDDSVVSQEQTDFQSISDDELRLLEAENRQLKASLVARLIDENARMREMLERSTAP